MIHHIGFLAKAAGNLETNLTMNHSVLPAFLLSTFAEDLIFLQVPVLTCIEFYQKNL